MMILLKKLFDSNFLWALRRNTWMLLFAIINLYDFVYYSTSSETSFFTWCRILVAGFLALAGIFPAGFILWSIYNGYKEYMDTQNSLSAAENGQIIAAKSETDIFSLHRPYSIQSDYPPHSESESNSSTINGPTKNLLNPNSSACLILSDFPPSSNVETAKTMPSNFQNIPSSTSENPSKSKTPRKILSPKSTLKAFSPNEILIKSYIVCAKSDGDEMGYVILKNIYQLLLKTNGQEICDIICESEMLHIIIQSLKSKRKEIQYEVAKVLSLITSDISKHEKVARAGAIPLLIELLKLGDPSCPEFLHLIDALSNITHFFPHCRDLCLSHVILPPLFQIVSCEEMSLQMATKISCIFSNLCNSIALDPAQEIIDSLLELLQLCCDGCWEYEGEQDVFHGVLMAFENLVKNGHDHIEALFQRNFFKRLRIHIPYSDEPATQFIFGCLNGTVSCCGPHLQGILGLDLFHYFNDFFYECDDPDEHLIGLSFLSNIVQRITDFSPLINGKVITMLFDFINNKKLEWEIYQLFLTICKACSPQNAEELIEQNFIFQICGNLDNPKRADSILDMINDLLKKCNSQSAWDQLLEDGSLEKIKQLQMQPSLAKKANEILRSYIQFRDAVAADGCEFFDQ